MAPLIPSLTPLIGNRHVAERIKVVLRVVAGIAKVSAMYRVVTATAIAIGIGVEQNRTNSDTHHEVAMVGPVSC